MTRPTEIDLRTTPASSQRWWAHSRLPGRWTPTLYAVVASLLVASLALRVVGVGLEQDFRGLNSLERWFSVDREMGLPAWFSTVLLFSCAAQLWLLADADRSGPRRRWARRGRLLAVVFVYLSIDELTEIHEQSMEPLQQGLGLGGVLQFAWVVLALPLVAILGLVMLGWLRALPRGSRWCVVASGVLYVGGAAGVELIGSWLWATQGQDTLTYAAVATLEEGLEMGALVFFLGTLWTLRRVTAVATVAVDGDAVGRAVEAPAARR